MVDRLQNIEQNARRRFRDMGAGTDSINYWAEVVALAGVAAGQAAADLISVQGVNYGASASITRTNDTNAYLAGDVIGAATGSTAAITFANIGPAGGGYVLIAGHSLRIDSSSVISGQAAYRLHLYAATPASALGDNTPFNLPSGDRANYRGYLDLGTPVDFGDTLYVETNSGVTKQILVPSGGSLFGYLQTIGAYTPVASTVHTIGLRAAGM